MRICLPVNEDDDDVEDEWGAFKNPKEGYSTRIATTFVQLDEKYYYNLLLVANGRLVPVVAKCLLFLFTLHLPDLHIDVTLNNHPNSS
jgi:hypothetical protein